jgi:predicted phage terminase large subunit-like protein
VDDANSRAKLEADLLTFREALPTRVNSDQSAIVIIMQRLNEADVSAAAIALGYDHLCIPMRYEPGRSKWVFGKGDPRTQAGELMFPERFSEAQVVELEQSMGSYAVAGQLQQRPSPRGGGIIKGQWFGQYETLPELEWLAIYADTAQKTGQEHDYSVFELWGRSVTGQAILVDLRRGKWEAPELLAEARSFWLSCRERFGPKLRSMKVEDKVSGTGLIQTLRREGIAVLPVKRNRDKVSRAYDAAPFIESGNVLLPAWTPWLADFVGECETFPSGANDDQLDPMFDAMHDVQFQRAEKRHGGTYAIPATVTAFSR